MKNESDLKGTRGDSETNKADSHNVVLQDLSQQLQIRAMRMRLRSATNHLEVDGRQNDTSTQLADQDVFPKATVFIDMSNNLMDVQEEHQRSAHIAPPPPSKARLRRRDRVKGGPDIHNYKPGYTWNRGGRLKELRIRCTVRKYYILWKKKTFGRVLPSEARLHFKKKLLKAVFDEWSMLWWEARKEWGLSIRADLHNRYRLWGIVWRAWRKYHKERGRKAARYRQAGEHADRCLLTHTLHAWQLYFCVQREKRVEQQNAARVYSHCLTRRVWGTWLRHHREKTTRHEQEMAASQLWTQRCLRKVWNGWQKAHQARRMTCAKQGQADLYYKRELMKRCLLALVAYSEVQSRKLQLYSYADQVNDRRLTITCFHTWQEALVTARLDQAMLEQADHRGNLTRCRRMFLRWKYFVWIEQTQRQNKETAANHCRLKLQKSAMSSWRLYVVRQRSKVMRNKMAAEFSDKMITHNAFRQWTDRMEEKEEVQLLPLTQKALKYYHSNLLEVMMERWVQYIKWRRHRQSQYAVALAHYEDVKLPAVFTRWTDYTRLRRRKHELDAVATDFLRQNYEAKYFYLWQIAYETRQDERMMQRMAVLHHHGNVMRSTFLFWRVRTQDCVHEALSLEVASEHYDAALCRNALHQWRQYMEDIHRGVELNQRAVTHHCSRSIRRGWSAWRQYLETRRRKSHQTQRAHHHFNRLLLKRIMCTWKRFHKRCCHLAAEADSRYRHKQTHSIRIVFREWQVNARLQRIQTERENLAHSHHIMRTVSQVFSGWREFAHLHSNKKQATAIQVDNARFTINRGIVHRTFQRWRDTHAAAVRTRHQVALADAHLSSKLLRLSWVGWRDYLDQCYRKQLLARQSLWFHDTRLQAVYFLHWRSALSNAQVVKQKSYTALWLWSLTLQRKVLFAWIEYTQEQKRKSARQRMALEQYQRRLLVEGASKWLVFAGDMSSLRQRFAAKRGIQNYYELQQTVARCAAHWRRVTSKRKATRSNAAPSVHQASCRLTQRASDLASPAVRREVKEAGSMSGCNPSGRSIPQPVQVEAFAAVRSVTQTAATGKLTTFIEPDKCPPQRPQPRRPTFLVESLKRAGLYSSTSGNEAMSKVTTTCRAGNESGSEDTRVDDGEGGRQPCHRDTEAAVVVLPCPEQDAELPPAAAAAAAASSRQGVCQLHPEMGQPAVDLRLGQLHPEMGQPAADLRLGQLHPEMGQPAVDLRLGQLHPEMGQPAVDLRLGQLHPEMGQPAVDLHLGQLHPEMGQPAVDLRLGQLHPEMGQSSRDQPLTLLTPASFLRRRDGTPLNQCILPSGGHLHATLQAHDMTPHNVSKDTMVDSVLADIPDLDSQTDREFCQEALVSPADEMLHIRDQLLAFQQLRRKLKLARKQQKLLTAWLAEQSPDGATEEDVYEVQAELCSLNEDIASLTSRIEERKQEVDSMKQRARQLLPTIET